MVDRTARVLILVLLCVIWWDGQYEEDDWCIVNWMEFEWKRLWPNRDLPRHFPGDSEKNHKNLHQDRQWLGRDHLQDTSLERYLRITLFRALRQM
jgi:hypothetical protein